MKHFQVTNEHFKLSKDQRTHFHIVLIAVISTFLAIYLVFIAFPRVTLDLESYTPDIYAIREGKLFVYLPPGNSQDIVTNGQIFTVNVGLKTGVPTAGVDIVLQYDPKYLQLVGAGNKSTFRYINTSSSIFQIFPYEKLLHGTSTEQLDFSALANPLKEYSGGGLIASVTFRAIASGQTEIIIPADQRQAFAPHVAFHGKNILVGTSGLHLTIK